ncbi:MAG: putative ABC transporter permease [Candidatus Saccharibacteria bacterium]|nr:putative ABC transporter permease [Candidatus Saccharibacteria bacterium]
MKKEKPLQKYQKVGILFLIIVISGIFGWLYEVIFYFFNNGMDGFYMQGGNFLPWINIYAVGAILILLTTYQFRKNPFLVFLISTIVTGLLELISGWLIFIIGNGTRYWDYNVEILNFGNIGGFVCLRSVLFFGLSALILMYLVLPFCIFLAKKLKKKTFLFLSISLFTIFMLDEIGNLTAKNLSLPTAMDFYKSQGIKYNNDL